MSYDREIRMVGNAPVRGRRKKSTSTAKEIKVSAEIEPTEETATATAVESTAETTNAATEQAGEVIVDSAPTEERAVEPAAVESAAPEMPVEANAGSGLPTVASLLAPLDLRGDGSQEIALEVEGMELSYDRKGGDVSAKLSAEKISLTSKRES